MSTETSIPEPDISLIAQISVFAFDIVSVASTRWWLAQVSIPQDNTKTRVCGVLISITGKATNVTVSKGKGVLHYRLLSACSNLLAVS